MSSYLTYITITAVCAAKYMIGVTMGLATQMSFIELFLCYFVGGSAGIVIYTLLGERVLYFFKKSKENKPINPNDWKVRLWNKYGLIGVALLTPPILSQPVGTSLSIAFGAPVKKVIPAMTISMLFWSLIFAFTGEKILSLF